MHIRRITIENLRNISNAEISPHKKINIITGNNGAGKTTLLESIYILARAGTFRQSKPDRLIKDGANQLNLFALLKSDNNETHKIGLQKNKKKTEIRKDGENLRKLSLLAKTIPLTIITTNIQRIVEEEPNQRRRLLNWGLFHVEPEYGELANRYKRVLTQRNNALRLSPVQISAWDSQLIELGEEIERRMDKYTEEWNKIINTLVEKTKLIMPISIKIKKGRREEETLFEALDRTRKIDRERGFTSCGPHRSDIRLLQDGRPIKGVHSRGESKITAVMMLLSQTKMLADKTGEKPILLADDLHSELDRNSYKGLINLIDELELQSFITTLDFENTECELASDVYGLFHVEHGAIANAYS